MKRNRRSFFKRLAVLILSAALLWDNAAFAAPAIPGDSASSEETVGEPTAAETDAVEDPLSGDEASGDVTEPDERETKGTEASADGIPEDVTGEKRRGITLVFSTDTRPCETLEKHCADADLLILEGMYGTEEKMPQALKNHHMLFREAAETARKAGTGGLLLTHFSTSMENPEEYLPAAREIFERTWAATDGLTVTMRYPENEEKAWTSLY